MRPTDRLAGATPTCDSYGRTDVRTNAAPNTDCANHELSDVRARVQDFNEGELMNLEPASHFCPTCDTRIVGSNGEVHPCPFGHPKPRPEQQEQQ